MFTNDFQMNGQNISNGNNFKESIKCSTYSDFDEDGKY